MTLLTKDMSDCRHVHKRKMSYHDKNVLSPPPKSESAGYVKVKLLADPLIHSVASIYDRTLQSWKQNADIENSVKFAKTVSHYFKKKIDVHQGIWRLDQSILGIETTPCRGLCWTPGNLLIMQPNNKIVWLTFWAQYTKMVHNLVLIIMFSLFNHNIQTAQ